MNKKTAVKIISLACIVLAVVLIIKEIKKPQIENVKFQQISKDGMIAKVTYDYKDREHSIQIKDFDIQAAKAEYYDFDKDGISEVFITAGVSAHSMYGYVYKVNSKGDLVPICYKDYGQDDNSTIDGVPDYGPIKEVKLCLFGSDKPSIQVIDVNKDGYLDIVTGNRDLDDPLRESFYLFYFWDKHTNKFIRN